MLPQPGFLQPALPRVALSRPAALCRRRPAPAPVRACASNGAAAAEASASDEDVLHETWKVYTDPGNKCVVCIGRGVSKCLYCFGEGHIKVGPEEGRDTVKCPLCEGSGKETCLRCHGSGIRPATRIDLETGEIVRNLTNAEVCQLPTQAEIEAEEAAKEAANEASDAPVQEDAAVQEQPSEQVVQ